MPLHLPGYKFNTYIRNMGELRFSDVRWFKIRDPDNHLLMFSSSEHFLERRIRFNAEHLFSSDPIYHSPFKHGPMHNIEYDLGTEGGGLLVDQDLTDSEELEMDNLH